MFEENKPDFQEGENAILEGEQNTTAADNETKGVDENAKASEQDTTDDEFDEIVYNKETVKIPKAERQTYLQKGYNYDKVKARADQSETALQRAARVTGYDTVEGYLEAVEQAELQAEAEKYQQAAQDPQKLKELFDSTLNNHPAIKKAQEIEFENNLIKQKESLKNERFFSILEPEINAVVKQTGVDARTAYIYLRGEKFDELLTQEAGTAKKAAIADIQDKAKRGVGSISSDGGGNDIEITDDIKEMAQSVGISPQKLLERLKNNGKLKRR
jgi:hypothetical protein